MDIEYYRDRAEQERAAAAIGCPYGRPIHTQLAVAYDERALRLERLVATGSYSAQR